MDRAMVDGMSTAQLTQASNVVQVAITEVEAIANKVNGEGDTTAEALAKFEDVISLDAAAFSGLPAGEKFATQHRAAAEVFLKTIDGVKADLYEFAESIKAAMAAHKATDEAAYETLVKFTAEREGRSLSSQQAYDQALAEQGSNLHGTGDAAPTDPGWGQGFDDQGGPGNGADAPSPQNRPAGGFGGV